MEFVGGFLSSMRIDGTRRKVYNLHMHGGMKVYMPLLSKGKTKGLEFYLLTCFKEDKWFVVKRLYYEK